MIDEPAPVSVGDGPAGLAHRTDYDWGVLVESENWLTVDAAHRGEWAYWDKYLYPSDWLRRRRLSDRLRVR